jgi:hypothetical protein
MTARASIFVASLLLGTSGCLTGYNGANGGDAGQMGADAGSSGVNVAADFAAQVAPILGGADGKSGVCGACHAVSGLSAPVFMSPNPDMLTSILSYPGLVGKTPETSRLYAKGVHEGPALTNDQASVLAGWIVEYNTYKPAAADAGADKPVIAPFAPIMGPNTVDLSVLDSRLAGQKLTFTGQMVGTSLELSQITIHTATSMGVHVVHPLWVAWDAEFNPTPDPADSFSNLDETVYGSTNAPLGPGLVVLPSFASGSKLSVVFSLIEPKMGGADGGTVAGCKALSNFVQNVKPMLQANCNACHVGANPTAGLSFDFGRNTDEQVCENALTEINKNTPAQSLLLQRPDPNNNDGHPQKIQNYAPYQTAVTNWINAEK